MDLIPFCQVMKGLKLIRLLRIGRMADRIREVLVNPNPKHRNRTVNPNLNLMSDLRREAPDNDHHQIPIGTLHERPLARVRVLFNPNPNRTVRHCTPLSTPTRMH
jgi:hypothetical protein